MPGEESGLENVVQLVAYGVHVKECEEGITRGNLLVKRGTLSTNLGEFASRVLLSETRIARLLWDRRRLFARGWMSEGRLARVDTSSALALVNKDPKNRTRYARCLADRLGMSG